MGISASKILPTGPTGKKEKCTYFWMWCKVPATSLDNLKLGKRQ